MITAQYLNYLHKLEELDVDVSAEFIYMAATLIYIKSKMLLPSDPLGETEDAAGDSPGGLGERLGERGKLKDAGRLLRYKNPDSENRRCKTRKSRYNGQAS